MRGVRSVVLAGFVAVLVALGIAPAGAEHSWGNYRWPTRDGVVDLHAEVSRVEGAWAGLTKSVVADWDRSNFVELDTRRAREQRVTVRSGDYGANGWLGIARIKIDTRGYIAAGLVELNEWYWRHDSRYDKDAMHAVYCQEVGHVLGLDHQDADSCMNDDQSVLGVYLHPNQHDYDELARIYRRANRHDNGSRARSCRRDCSEQDWTVVHVYPARDQGGHANP